MHAKNQDHSSRESEMPREKLVRVGATNVSDAELVAILLGTGSAKKNVFALSEELLNRWPLSGWASRSVQDWKAVDGIQLAKAATLVAAVELGERAAARRAGGPARITTPETALPFLATIRNQKKEHLVALYLNARLQVIHQETLFIGTVNAALTHPREVFAPALEHSAIALLIAHNHPSGSTEPSQEDIAMTNRLITAGHTLQITLLDHLIVTATDFLSLRKSGHVSEWLSEDTISHTKDAQMQDSQRTTQIDSSVDQNGSKLAVARDWPLTKDGTLQDNQQFYVINPDWQYSIFNPARERVELRTSST